MFCQMSRELERELQQKQQAAASVAPRYQGWAMTVEPVVYRLEDFFLHVRCCYFKGVGQMRGFARRCVLCDCKPHDEDPQGESPLELVHMDEPQAQFLRFLFFA